MGKRENEDKYVGAFFGGGIGAVIGVAGGPAGVAFGGGVGAWIGHAIEKWLDANWK